MARQRGRDNKPLAEINGDLRPRRHYFLYIILVLLLALIVLTALVRSKRASDLTHATFSPTPMASPFATALASPRATLPAPPS